MTCGTSSPEHRRSRGQAGVKADFRPRLPLLRPPPLSPRLAFSSSPGVPGSLRIFPESPRRILCAAAPPQLPGLCLAFSSFRACASTFCLALRPVFPALRPVPPWPQVVLPAFPPRSPFSPQASALPDGPCRGLSFCDRLCLSRVFPAPRLTHRRVACSGCPVHPRMPRPSLPAAFPSSFVFRVVPPPLLPKIVRSRRARSQKPCAFKVFNKNEFLFQLT